MSSTKLSTGWYWFVERDQIGLAYWNGSTWASPSEAKTLRVFGRGYPADISGDTDSYDIDEDFHEAPLFHALSQIALSKGDKESYALYKGEYLELVALGKKRAAENRTSTRARGLVPGVNTVGY